MRREIYQDVEDTLCNLLDDERNLPFQPRVHYASYANFTVVVNYLGALRESSSTIPHESLNIETRSTCSSYVLLVMGNGTPMPECVTAFWNCPHRLKMHQCLKVHGVMIATGYVLCAVNGSGHKESGYECNLHS